MREVTTTTKLYQFDELSDKAKERAREWFREASAHDEFWEFVYEDAAQCGEILGIDLRQRPVKLMGGGTRYDLCILFSGFWSQGDGACFEGFWYWKEGAAEKIREHAPEDTDLHGIADLIATLGPGWSAKMAHRGHYYHSGCMSVDVEFDDSVLGDGQELEQVKFSEGEDSIVQAMRGFADWIYRQLEKEHDYQNSDEVVDDNIRANEYEFEEDGTRA